MRYLFTLSPFFIKLWNLWCTRICLSWQVSLTVAGHRTIFASLKEPCTGEMCHTCSYATDLGRASIAPLKNIETFQCISAHELKQHENSLTANLN